MPQISLPDIKLPDIKFREGRLRDVKLPDIDLRDHLPDVDLSRLSLPSALRDMSMPEVSMSDMRMPEMHMPDVHVRDMHMPEVNLRDLHAPRVDLPEFDLRRLDPRRVDLSGVDRKRLREFARFGKPAPKPASPLPWVIVAAVSGFFAGWWVATSPVTGPKVRELTDRLRGRIDEWRAARAEWDDDHSDTIWSTAHSHADDAHPVSAGHSDGSWVETGTHDVGAWDAETGGIVISESDEDDEAGPDGAAGGTAYEPAGTGYEPHGGGQG